MRSFATRLILTLLCLVAPALARAVVISVEPADTTVTVGDNFTLRVVASSFADLKGYQLIHSFDAVHLTLLGVTAGDVLTGTGRAFAAYSVPDETAPTDSTWMDAAMLDGATAGPGVLAYLQFHAQTEGTGTIDCQHVELRDSANGQTTPGCVGGSVLIVGPVPTRASSWGKLKSVYR